MRIGILENNYLIRSFNVIDGLINTTIFISENWVSNPTIEQMATLGYKTIVDGIHQEPMEGYYESETFSEIDGIIYAAYELTANPINSI